MSEANEIIEEIVACAFKDTDGKVYVSRTCHAEILGMFFNLKDKEIGNRCEQGFITNLNRFVDRKEALQIAKNAGQKLHKHCDTEELYSEDIFWNPLDKNADKMFEELGYEKRGELEFFLDKDEDMHFVWHHIIFDKKFKGVSINGGATKSNVFLIPKEIAAINKKCEELGWFE